MTKEERLLIDQMLAVADLLIKKATTLERKSGGSKPRSRKGLHPDVAKKLVERSLKTMLGNKK